MADFTDVDPEHPPPYSLWTIFRFTLIDRLTGRRSIGAPGPPAPRIAVPRERLDGPSAAEALWLGHASFLLHLAGSRVLVDPVLSDWLGLFRRQLEPALAADELPPIDLLLITHAHRDHLDDWTVRQLRRDVPVVVPAGLARFFERRGFTEVEELRWWQPTERAGLRVTLVPARHWSRRGAWDLNASLWGGYVIEGGGRTLYHAGDSAYWRAFAEIGERFPAIDLAMLPIGAYEPSWFMEPSHMTPEEAGRAFLDLGAKRFLPMHWGTFRLSDEPLAEPIERLRAWWRRQRPAGRLHDVPVGGVVDLEAGDD